MKNFQKMLLVFISTVLLAGCQDGSQNPQPKEVESRGVNIERPQDTTTQML